MNNSIDKSKKKTLLFNVVFELLAIYFILKLSLVGMQEIKCPSMIKQNQNCLHFLDFVHFECISLLIYYNIDVFACDFISILLLFLLC